MTAASNPRTSPSDRLAQRVGGFNEPQLFALIAVPLFAIYLLTASWSQPYHIDPFTNVLSGWSLGTDASFVLENHEQLAEPEYYRNVAWVVEARDGVASQYPPGAALLAAPLYAVWPSDAQQVEVGGTNRPDVAPVSMLHPPLAPAAIVSSAAVAVAVALLGLSFVRAGGRPENAAAAALLVGLGTSAWSVAADRLWQHGPAMLWIALALVLTERHALASGFAYGAAILTRPVTAAIAASTGLVRAWQERSVGVAVATGVGSVVGLIVFVLYNQLVFGSPSLSAGYGPGFQDAALSTDLVSYLRNVALGFVSATRGFLIWSPFLLVLIPGVPAAWRAAAPWIRGSALGGLAYLLIQYKANRFSGGDGFFAYRYPLEALTAAAPLLFLSYQEWVAKHRLAQRVLPVLAIISVVIHALGAVL